MRKILLLVLFLFQNLLSNAQSNVSVPKGIAYKRAPETVNKKAAKLLLEELQNSNTFNLFDSIMIIGPNLWKRYSKIPSLASIKEGNILLKTQNFENSNSFEKIPAKIIQTGQDYKTVLAQIKKEFAGMEIIQRKLSVTDLRYYWSVIFFDIEEPVFVLEGNGKKFLFDMEDNKILWVDELK
ncbi:hypothetical protein [Ferruginibacter sp. HRS2-29]|uniref:hypothetical protein n=1 Tax=Ferruginibacter sp. HRS2-29 TaxID=2487334 RepID=UPI0020CEB6B3|nr:hypothetical protein [Ferruginibacter sp. HRS2-29]MCP9751024.1 hypothetical protein [Ferruginibacter sp. HRS2-29]